MEPFEIGFGSYRYDTLKLFRLFDKGCSIFFRVLLVLGIIYLSVLRFFVLILIAVIQKAGKK